MIISLQCKELLLIANFGLALGVIAHTDIQWGDWEYGSVYANDKCPKALSNSGVTFSRIVEF